MRFLLLFDNCIWLKSLNWHPGIPSSSAKSEIGFRKCTPRTDPSPHPPQTFRMTDLQSSTMLRSVQWCDCVVKTFQKLVQSFQLIYCTSFFHVCPLDFNCFNGFLNCSVHFKSILNYSIPWDIDYTQACTTPITKIMTPRVITHQMSIHRCNDYFMHWVE